MTIRPEEHVAPVGRSAPDAMLDADVREIVTRLGHELKTPLAIMLGLCARVLDADRLQDDDADDLLGIRAAAYTLLERVEDLLHLTRVGAGSLTLDTRRVDVAALVRETVATFESVAETGNQVLFVDAPEHLAADIDEDKLLTILSNLLVNALRWTPHDGTIRCTLSERAGRVRLEIGDSGPGIPSELRDAVFERYRQVPGRGIRGSGLGLAIVREFAEAHGGSVTVGDAPEGGALFIVEVVARAATSAADVPSAVPIAERQRPAVERLEAELAAGKRRGPAGPQNTERPPSALVVTADQQLGTLVADVLGDRFVIAHARDAVDAVRAIAARAPDVVILDAAAGAHAAASLRRRPPGAQLLALAAGPDDLVELLAAGADDCVAKPFAPAELAARAGTLAARARAHAVSVAATAALERAFDSAPTPMLVLDASGRVLLDNPALRTTLGGRRLAGLPVDAVLHPSDRASEAREREQVVEGRAVVARSERRLARADGSYVVAHVRATAADTDDMRRARSLLWLVDPSGDPAA